MWGIRGISAWLPAFTLNYRLKHPATYGRHKPRTLRLKYAQVRIYQLENRYHFWDSLKLTNKYPILSKDLKEPLLSIKTSQEHTRLPCVVCFKRKFPKNLPSTSAFSESFCQKFQEIEKALKKATFHQYNSEALLI